MRKDKLTIIILIAIFIVIISLAFKQTRKTSSPTPPPTSQKQTKITSANKEGIVEITDKGFSPQTIAIKKGSSVTWINHATFFHDIESDPHPSHSLSPFLNTDEPLIKNDSVTINFEKTGTYTYHDELNPLKFKGSVVVE